MKRMFAGMVLAAMTLGGCGGQSPVAPESGQPAAAPTPVTAPAPEAQTAIVVPPAQPDDAIAMRNFAAVKIGPYDVQPMFEEEVVNGHYNIKVSGGEVKAVRMWVGPEDASGVMVVKTEPENDYNHGHVEVPNPVPDDAKLWIEIEDPAGTLHKGYTLLKQVS